MNDIMISGNDDFMGNVISLPLGLSQEKPSLTYVAFLASILQYREF